MKKHKRRLAVLIGFFTGFGITVHAAASELFYKGGYEEILSFQGEWIGLALMLMSFLGSIKLWVKKGGEVRDE